MWFTMSNLQRYFEIKSSRLTFEGESGEEVPLLRLTSLSRWSVVKFKTPCNFDESSYVASVLLPRVIYENIDIVFIEIYRIQLSMLKVIFLKYIPFRLKKLSFLSITNKNGDIGKGTQSGTMKREMLNEANFNQTNFLFL